MAFPAAANEESDTSLEAERYGCDVATAKAISKLTWQYIWQEETRAINDEALTCLRKTASSTWAAADDYAALVRHLAEREADVTPSQRAKLSICAYFAEFDNLVGRGGQRYLEECFRQQGISNTIDFQSSIRPNTDHNTIIIDHKAGPIVEIFKNVAELKG